MIDHRARRSSTDAARAASLEKRREAALHPRDMRTPEIFVVRLISSELAFTWEIRRFGGVVLERGETGFPSMKQAHSSGVQALAALAPP